MSCREIRKKYCISTAEVCIRTSDIFLITLIVCIVYSSCVLQGGDIDSNSLAPSDLADDMDTSVASIGDTDTEYINPHGVRFTQLQKGQDGMSHN